MKKQLLDMTARYVNRIEHRIAPPMSVVVTLPLKIGAEDRGLCIYVAAAAFGRSQPSDDEMMGIAREVAARINGEDE